MKNQLEGLAHNSENGVQIDQLHDLVELVSSALNDTRELSRLLRPPVLDDLGLLPALQWLTRTMCERTGLQVRLDWELEEEQLRSEADIETLIFRVVQEALNNVVKHAGVNKAWVKVFDETRYVGVQVADEGKGFNAVKMLEASATDVDAGSGLRGIRDRLELFGGSLDVHSVPGQGTLLHMRVPMAANYPHYMSNRG
jgi:two-component system NarL family sensor kinase